MIKKICSLCDGTKRYEDKTCRSCLGAGYVIIDRCKLGYAPLSFEGYRSR